jgi:pimeloyl-ACP methyl ester carboxylesterase
VTLTHLDVDGVRLAVQTWGDPAAPAIVLVHGWGQSSRAWERLAGRLPGFHLIAPDLRGHGESDAPDDGYDRPGVWADELDAVLDFAGRPAVVVGWSYGGLVITDYVRERGTRDIAGICFTGALTEIGRDRPGGRIGAAMKAALPSVLAEDPAVAEPALTALMRGMGVTDDAEVRRMVEETLRVAPAVRGALFRRDIGSADVLEKMDIPVLIVHGTVDEVVHVTAAEYAGGKIPGARVRLLPGVGHLPFDERPAEFAAALVEFAGWCAG